MIGGGLPLLLVAAALGVAGWGGDPVAGWPNRDVVAALLLAAFGVAITGWAAERARPGWRAAVGAVAMWAVFVATGATLFVQREAVIEGARSFAEEAGVAQPGATVTGTGEVAVSRGPDGSFVVPARVNGVDTRFIFDTGATSVVLTAETASLLGLRPEALRFTVPVQTANGRTMAAPIRLDRLTVGDITFNRVAAVVSRPGQLHENLLGQSFLERLDSYEVRGRRLVMRAARS